MTRTYSELVRLPTFEERFRYLSLQGQVGRPTFGYDRWINQRFYHSALWKQLRRDAIVRDSACDLAISDREIHSGLIVHHMNPMDVSDIVEGNPNAVELEHLICTTHDTHNAIHYGDERLLRPLYVERKPGDTLLWRKKRS